VLRFGVFEVDLRSGELRRQGLRLRLPDQSFQVLTLLLEHPGELVSREELREKLWPADTFVDFDHGLNAAVNRLREALGDSADSPRFVETLPRRGYRFIGPIESEEPAKAETATLAAPRQADTHVQPRWQKHRKLVLSGVGALLVICVGAYFLKQRPRELRSELTIVPFTTYPGFETAPSFSPDGNQMAFAWSRGQFNFDLYIKQIGQERAVRLTYRPATFLAPAWSPDGRFIAFARRGKDDNDTGIYLVPALGGSERRLADATSVSYYPRYMLSWSPDGKWLAFSKEDTPVTNRDSTSPQQARIHLLNVERVEERVLPDPSPDCALNLEPAFSPDGKYVASVCMLTEGVNKIYIQPLDGGRAREVALVKASAGFGGWLEGLAWTTDNQSLVYVSDRRLWSVPSEGGKPERLPFVQQAIQMPAVAHVGNRLAYAQITCSPNIWRLELTSSTRTAGSATKIISSSRGELNPQISPDGKHIAFESERSGNLEIWVSDQDGSNPVQVSSFGVMSFGGMNGRPHWSPDSRRIVFSSNASGRAELYVVNADGGQQSRLPTTTQNAITPFWSVNGRWIYFASHVFSTSQEPAAIWKLPADGGAAIRLTKEGRYDPQESPDGTRIFYVVADHEGGKLTEEIWSVPADGGDERLETPMTTNASWTPAERGLYFLDGVDVGLRRGRLRFFDFATRHFQNVAELEPGVTFPGDMSVSRDGKTIFYSEIDNAVADIILVEGFR
jgi:Tol biopolymer transport system component/DNA-binding winged helix-turn-helix (wHTH) protein